MSNIKLVHSGGNSVSLTTPDSNPAANRTVKFPDANGTLALTNGITEFDSWYLTANKTSNGDLTSNLARQNKLGSASPLGTGMSQSSGVFTFPSTGKWLVIVEALFVCNDNDNVTLDTNVTLNNSSYTKTHSAIDGNNGSGDKHGSAMTFCFLDVTDTSQVKVKFSASSIGSGSYVVAQQSYVETAFHFVRIGNT